MVKGKVWLVGVLAVVLVGVLYSLPKVAVSTNRAGANRDVTAKDKPDTSQTATKTDSETHSVAAIDPELQKQIDQLRAKFFIQKDLSSKEKLAEELAQVFVKANKFDSAAAYSERMAQLKPNEKTWLRAGDRYYDAYTFAVDADKMTGLGDKTRACYQKALAINPNLLGAKANMAMTYATTSTPMQGILMLREVIAVDPTNELALFNLGMLSLRSNQFAKAAERFRQILNINPENTKAQFYLAVSFAELGKKNEALAILEAVKAKEKDPNIQAAVKELEKSLK